MRRVSSVNLVTPCMRNKVMTRLVRADQTWGPFPVRMSDLSSFQITSPVRVLDPPVAADVGEQVLRGGVVRGEAGEVEDGLGAAVPLPFLLVRDIPLDQH